MMTDPIQALFDRIMEDARDQKRAESSYYNLGDLIDALEGIDSTLPVEFTSADGRYGNDQPGEFFSWRGDYHELALGYCTSKVYDWNTSEYIPVPPPTVGSLLARCIAADGATFEGYKGGDFTMNRSCRIFVEFDQSYYNGPQIADVTVVDGKCLIKLENWTE